MSASFLFLGAAGRRSMYIPKRLSVPDLRNPHAKTYDIVSAVVGKRQRKRGQLIERQPTSGDYAVNVWMVLHFWGPGVNTLKNPVSAPRRLGLRASSRDHDLPARIQATSQCHAASSIVVAWFKSRNQNLTHYHSKSLFELMRGIFYHDLF